MTNENTSIPVSDEGLALNYTSTSTDAYVYSGTSLLSPVTSNPDAGEYTLTASGTNITAGLITIVGNHFSVGVASNLVSNQDTYNITLTASGKDFLGNPFSSQKVQSITPVKRGNDATSYWETVTSSVITKDVKGNLAPTDTTVSSLSQSGMADPIKYKSIFKVYFKTGSAFSTTPDYTSSAPEDSYKITPSSDVNDIKIEMYDATGQTLLDIQTVPVIAQANGVISTKIEYTVTTTSDQPTDTANWSDTMPNVAKGQYLWTKTTFYYTDGSNATAYSMGSSGLDGSSASLLTLSSDSQVFTFASNGTTPNPTSQTINLTANLQNITGTATFVATPYLNGAAGTPISLGGTGNARTLTVSQFGTTYDSVVIKATLGSLSDTETIHKLTTGATGASGTNAISGWLTNEAITLQADSNGNVPSFTAATGSFSVYNGITQVTGLTVTQANATGITVSISGMNYSVTGMSADTGYVDLSVTTSGVTITKRLTVAKSKAGATGANGTSVVNSTTPPNNPVNGQWWNDMSVTPNILKVYQSGSWVIYQLDAVNLVSNSIKTSNLAADVLTASNVVYKNSDGTTTNLQTFDFNGFSVSIQKAQTAADNANNAINNLAVGGRNYFLNSSGISLDKWNNNSNLWSITTDSTKGSVFTSKPTVAWTGGAQNALSQGGLNTLIGQQVTISFWAKADKANANFHSEPNGGAVLFNPKLTTSWAKYSYTIPSLATGTIYFMSVDVGTTYYLDNLKIETGNSATDWSPAPEDVQSGIDAAQSGVNTLSQVNLINNSDFSPDLAGWTSRGAGNFTTGNYDYSGGVYVVESTNSTLARTSSAPIPLNGAAGQVAYSLSFNSYIFNLPSGGRVTSQLTFLDSNLNETSSSYPGFTELTSNGTGKWVTTTLNNITFTPPTGAVYVVFSFDSIGLGTKAGFNRPILVKGATVGNYVKGDYGMSTATTLKLTADNYTLGIDANGNLISGITGNTQSVTIKGAMIHLDGNTVVDQGFFSLWNGAYGSTTIDSTGMEVVTGKAKTKFGDGSMSLISTKGENIGWIGRQVDSVYDNLDFLTFGLNGYHTTTPGDEHYDDNGNNTDQFYGGDGIIFGISTTGGGYLPLLQWNSDLAAGYRSGRRGWMFTQPIVAGLTVYTENANNDSNGIIMQPQTIDNVYYPVLTSISSGGSTGYAIGLGASYMYAGNTRILRADSNGYLYYQTTKTGSSGKSLLMASDGAIIAQSSATKYKSNIKYEKDTTFGDKLLTIDPATWSDKNEVEQISEYNRTGKEPDYAMNKDGARYYGLIAEDMVKAGLEELVVRDTVTGAVEGIQYEKIGAALIPLLREQRNQINILKLEVEKLKVKINE